MPSSEAVAVNPPPAAFTTTRAPTNRVVAAASCGGENRGLRTVRQATTAPAATTSTAATVSAIAAKRRRRRFGMGLRIAHAFGFGGGNRAPTRRLSRTLRFGGDRMGKSKTWVGDRFFTDSEPNSKYPLYTRAHAGGMMPGPVSPLSATLGMLQAVDLGWRDAYVRLGIFRAEDLSLDGPVTVGQFGGYLYLNLSCARVYGLRMPGLSPELVDFRYVGNMPGIPPYADEARPD